MRKGRSGKPPAHLHIENLRALGEVFEATPRRVKEALARRPWLEGRVRITIGYDGDIYGKAMRTADALFGWRFERRDLGSLAPRLKWVHAHGAGVNHLMPLDWLPKGAVLTNSRGVHGPRADEYTVMALLMLNNGLPRMAANQRCGKWEQVFESSIAGKTLLVVGVGHVGGGAARWAKRFGLHVIGVRRSGRPHRHVDEMHRPEALRRLLPRADFVLVAAPHTAESHHLIGAGELALMKRGAGLVNYSRAELVDYAALGRHLAAGRLAAVLERLRVGAAAKEFTPLEDAQPHHHAPFLVGRPRALYAQDARPRDGEPRAPHQGQTLAQPGERQAPVLAWAGASIAAAREMR